MNAIPLYPRTSGYPSAFSPVPARTSSVSSAAPVTLATDIRRHAPALSVLTDGEAPLDRASLENPFTGLQMPASMLFTSELPGATPFEKGLALRDQVRARKAAGEFSAYQPTLLVFHGTVQDGELLLTDAQGSFMLPAIVLLHELSAELKQPAAAHDPRSPAPVVLSCCFAEQVIPTLRNFPRPVLVNGSNHELDILDAQTVFHACAKAVEVAWRADRTVCKDTLFDVLSTTSGDRVHQLSNGEWLEHALPFSTASLSSLDDRQAALYLRAMLVRGNADDLAEGLLLFGTAPMHRLDPSITPLQYLLEFATYDLAGKVQLLLLAGEDVNAIDEDGDTLLHTICDIDPAARGDRTSEELALRYRLGRLVLAYGADPHKPNAEGITPADLAYAAGHPALTSLFEHGANVGTRLSHQAQLKVEATRLRWSSVLSLLADPSQLDDVDDAGVMDDGSDSTDDAATPAQISENSDS